MIKLKSLIKEEEQNYDLNKILDYINRYPCETLIFRGENDDTKGDIKFVKIKTRKLLTTTNAENAFLEGYKKSFNINIPNRKKCVFASTSSNEILNYGYITFVIFPNNCDIYYNKEYRDTITMINNISSIINLCQMINYKEILLDIGLSYLYEFINKISNVKSAGNYYKYFLNIDFKKIIEEFEYLQESIEDVEHSDDTIEDILYYFNHLKTFFDEIIIEKNRIYNLSNKSNIELMIDGNEYLCMRYNFFLEKFKWNGKMWELRS